ncbi:hypothetical protein [Terrabacter sp. 2RAF25]|uniref:hypothetical protein n=1 Tax=Terrabacter sp. 2RAF25 TaxID=3232998 RepID=UPI003F9AE696
MTDPVVTASEVADVLVGDDGSVVLVESAGQHQVLRLSVLGQAVREIAVSGVPLSRLTDELVARFGSAGPDPAAEVQALVAQLASAGLVRVDG